MLKIYDKKFKTKGLMKNKDINNLPTCVVLEYIWETISFLPTLNTSIFESLPRAQKLVFYHESFTKEISLSELYVCQISRPRDSPKKSYS
jgi:hypothetical protein